MMRQSANSRTARNRRKECNGCGATGANARMAAPFATAVTKRSNDEVLERNYQIGGWRDLKTLPTKEALAIIPSGETTCKVHQQKDRPVGGKMYRVRSARTNDGNLARVPSSLAAGRVTVDLPVQGRIALNLTLLCATGMLKLLFHGRTWAAATAIIASAT
jgi:hypothetical protein